MSRGVEGRSVAWDVWRHFHTHVGQVPVAYIHQCGALGSLDGVDLADVHCPGCWFELGRPELECQPLYAAPHNATGTGISEAP